MQYSSVKISELNEEFRIDSEYYCPENLRKEDVVVKCKHDYLGNLVDLISGPFGSTVTTEKYDPESGKRYIRGMDVQPFFLKRSDAVYVDTELFSKLTQFHLRPDDLLLTVVGMKFGKVAIVREEDTPAIFSCKSTLLRNSKINVWYLLAYLSSGIGYGLIRRGERGAAQPGINLFDIRTVPVPLFSEDFQKKIGDVIKESRTISKGSSALFSQAENDLLTELGLDNWQPKQRLTFVKNHSDAKQAKRYDAEYFQPKYEEIVKAIKGYEGGWDTLGNVVSIKNKNIRPKENQKHKYIELSNITGNGEVADCMTEEGQELPSRARRIVATGDVIVSSIEGSLDSIALIEKEFNNAFCSTGFYVIKSRKYNSESLLVLLKSMVGQLQLKKGCNGTILTAINNAEFSEVIVPILQKEKQTEIKSKVAKSFKMRKKAKYLLELTKQAVEIAIEQDEKAATVWLKGKIPQLGSYSKIIP